MQHRLSCIRSHGLAYLLSILVLTLVWGGPVFGQVDDISGAFVHRVIDVARRAGESVRLLSENPLDDWRRIGFHRAIGQLGELLRDLARRFRFERTPANEVDRVQHQLIEVFEASAGRENGNIIRQAMREIDWGRGGSDDVSPGTGPDLAYAMQATPRGQTREGKLTVSSPPKKILPFNSRTLAPTPTRRLSMALPRLSAAAGKVKDKEAVIKESAEATSAFRQIDILVLNAPRIPADVPSAQAPAPGEKEKRPGRARTVTGSAVVATATGEATANEERKSAWEDSAPSVSGPGLDDIGGNIPSDASPAPVPEDTTVEPELAGIAVRWPSGRARQGAIPPEATFSAEDVEELLRARGQHMLLTVIVCVSLAVWAFYLGLMFRARRSQPRKRIYPRLPRDS